MAEEPRRPTTWCSPDTRSNRVERHGVRPDNYEITSIMHNQHPWANRSDKPLLVTYKPISRIDEDKIVGKSCFQHIVHGVPHVAFLINLLLFMQGRRRTWHCDVHTLINSQETGFISASSRRGNSERTICSR